MTAAEREVVRELVAALGGMLEAYPDDFFCDPESSDHRADCPTAPAQRALARAEALLAEPVAKRFVNGEQVLREYGCAEPVASATEPYVLPGTRTTHQGVLGETRPQQSLVIPASATEPLVDQLAVDCITSLRAERDAALARAEQAEAERDRLAAEVERLTEENRVYRMQHADQFQILQKRREENDRLAAELSDEKAIHRDTSDRWARTVDELNALRAELATARACSTCGGSPPASGRVCICGGSNSRDREVVGLRETLFDARAELATARQDAAEQVRAAHDRCCMIGVCRGGLLAVADAVERGPAKE